MQIPFPLASTIHTDWGSKIFPLFLLWEQKTDQHAAFHPRFVEPARLVGYKNDYAAYVAYQMRTRPISLVVTSDKVAQPRMANR